MTAPKGNDVLKSSTSALLVQGTLASHELLESSLLVPLSVLRDVCSESGFGLIPISGVGVAVDEVKTGGNGVNSRTPSSDMVAG